MKKIIFALFFLVLGCVVGYIAPHDQTASNVAIYEAGTLIDEDGEIYKGDWGIDDGTYLVTYKTNGTFPRQDDEPIKFQPLD